MKKYAVCGIVGDEAVRLYEEGQPLNKSQCEYIRDNGAEIFRMFDSENEANAYALGIQDVHGWDNCVFTDPKIHKRIYGKISGWDDLQFIKA